MSLKLALLKNVKHRPTKIVAQCPACAEVGADRTGNHLVVFTDGRFGCTAHPKDKSHRRRIAELVGEPDRQVRPWTLKLRGKIVTAENQPNAAGIPITSLARSSVKGLKWTSNNPSEPSVNGFSDNTDACKDNTHCTAKNDQVSTVHIKSLRHPSEVSENATDATPSETSGSALSIHPSEPSEDIVTKALTLFEGKVVAVIPPDAIVPGRFRDVLTTWTPTHNHPGLQGYTQRRLLGWTRRGSPIYSR
jgi:hypothetical protein